MTEETNSLPPEILEQAASLRRGVLSIVPENGLEEKLVKSQRTGKPLRIKLGLDPTAPDIHLGFAVVLRKLRQFQNLGHDVIIIIGDYTALIGDPSGRSATRPMLTQDEIQANARTYVDQLARILDREKTHVRFNSEWLGKLDFAQVVQLASKITVARVLERDDFAQRYTNHQPISLHELLYPLAQACDSVAISADIEMGGQDQMFNILTGRDLQREEGQDPQIGFFLPLLVGLDGVKKMSKSLGNYIGITEPPDTMFAKIMSLSDDLMETYFELCTDVPMATVHSVLAQAGIREPSAENAHPNIQEAIAALGLAKDGQPINPKDVKRWLGREVVTIYHGVAEAEVADGEWQRVHSQHELPTEMPEVALHDDTNTGHLWICKLLVMIDLAKSNGEARRLIEQGGVALDGAKLTDPKAELPLASLAGKVIKVGARRYVRLRVE